ncbi:MAG: hypothetical protein K2X56_06010 [Mycobacterium pseudokansasii]|uniref:hypothetical protein n=1 Tax=Mycobacterium pseudokansasii TaxID=2341080 RepID=UPI000A3DCF9D|nr:hypothetical protein [Mycobacterium pseudokansasii]MBY0387654.1 hypothetical protein [Mycobacterium pseudokansasii]VAZ91661.1 hypothetical protein LAUMK35_01693 [Mycobacterium pseudokansasii]VAZ92631.1 hypothetical protein LAUMK21_01692 [Mycobacterium pseudokansasii]
MFRELAVGAIGVGLLGAGLFLAPPVQADDPPYHILSAQDLCNLVYPSSEAMPDPSKASPAVGLICVRQGGLLLRLARDQPAIFSNTFALEPGKAPELPKGSVRVNPNDPLSDWIIPDCYIPDRIDCNPNAPGHR